MRNSNRFLKIIILASILLAGCKHQEYTHKYLLQNPELLSSEMARCQSEYENNNYCKMVKWTQEDFIGLVSVRQNNPEKFGQQILETQQNLVLASQALQKARQDYPKGSEQITAAEQAYNELLEKLSMLLAVVKVTTME